jgi:hypothetical protein
LNVVNSSVSLTGMSRTLPRDLSDWGELTAVGACLHQQDSDWLGAPEAAALHSTWTFAVW